MGEDCETGDCLSVDPLTERVLGEVQTGKMCSFCGQSWRSWAQVVVQEIANLHCISGCFRFSLWSIAVLVEVSFTFPLSIQANHRVVSEIAVWTLPYLLGMHNTATIWWWRTEVQDQDYPG